jgi:hypothetical protein
MTESFDNAVQSLQQFRMGGNRPADDDGPPVAGVSRVGLEAEADHVKDLRCVTRKTHARFTDFIVHFRMDWRSVCRGIDSIRADRRQASLALMLLRHFASFVLKTI